MAAQKPSLPKGTRDFGPKEVQRRRYILNTIETVFKKYGFMPLETPAMENLSTLEGKYGDEGDKLLFRIINSGNPFEELLNEEGEFSLRTVNPHLPDIKVDVNLGKNRLLKAILKKTTEKGLRYDLTVPFARYVVMNRNDISFPFRRYQMQPVWRADKPQKGRYREFWQCDADVVGSNSLLNELDLIQVYHEAFTRLGINYELKINNRKILAGIAETVKGGEYMNTIAVAIDKLDKIGEDGVRKELTEQGFSGSELEKLFGIISIKGDNLAVLNELKPLLATSEQGLKGIEELIYVFECIDRLNIETIQIKTDFSLARGLSYYTGCIFEVVANDGSLRSSIGGGGRYDNLTGIFGMPDVSGVGISFGLDRISDVMEELKLFPDQLKASDTKVLFCYFDEISQMYCLPALKMLRDAGIAAEIFPDKKKLGKQLDYANALQIPFAAIAGDHEISGGVFNLKNLTTGEQKTVTTSDLVNLLRPSQTV